MTAFYIWIAIAALLFIFEIITFTVVCLCLSLGAVAAAIAALLGGAAWMQWAVFAACTLASFFLIRPLVLNILSRRHSDHPRTNAEALLGKRGVVTQAIPGGGRTGRIIIDGDNWQALSADDSPIPQGKQVEVTGIDSIILTVRPVNPQ